MIFDDRVLDLVERAQELQQQGLPVRVEELCRDCPDLRAFFQEAWEAVNRMDQVLDTPVAQESVVVPPEAGPPVGLPRLPGYEVIGPLGQGGMGVVYRARQLSARREVALKMIRGPALATPREVERFRTEAEELAGLDHPHIVPVYEVGEHQGQPWFSMKLIKGSSLEEQAARPAQDWRAVARLVETVARAVHHAHQRGILHRDLKPANVLLDTLGEPHVADFGLAKRVHDSERLTQSGAILGTPGYMAPEQTEGGRKPLSTAVDTWALGGILYALLTGKPPFPKTEVESPVEVLLQVRTEEPVPPRRLRPRVPADLETICLKCLRKDPGQRYATAADLAEDLRRFQAGEPIVARPVGVVERVVKWARRRPWMAGMLAALVLGAVAAGWAVYQGQVTRRAEEQVQTELNRFEQVLVGVMRLVKTDEGLRAQEPHREPERRDLLKRMEEGVNNLPDGAWANPEVRRLRGRIWLLRGNILLLLGEIDTAKAVYEQAIREWERLSEAFPDEPLDRSNLVRGYNQVGGLLLDSNQFEEARAACGQAVELSQGLVKAFPGNSECEDVRATSLYHQGRLMHRQGAFLFAASLENPRQARQQADLWYLQAERALGEARDLQEKLKNRSTAQPDLLYKLAKTRYELAGVWESRGHPHKWKAEPAYREALALYEPLVVEFPRVSEYRQLRARCCCALGKCLGFDSRRVGEVANLYRQAMTDQQRLAADFPRVPVYRAELADSHAWLGELLEKNLGRPEESDKNYREARTLYRKLVADFPSVEPYLRSLAENSNRLANLRRRHSLPSEHQFQCWLATLNQSPLQSLAPLLLARDNLADASRLLDEAILHQERAQVLSQDPSRYRWALFKSHRDQVEVLLARRNHARAAEVAERLPGFVPGHYDGNLTAALFLARCVPLTKLDGQLSATRQVELADTYARAAVELLDKAFENGYRNLRQVKIDARFQELKSRQDFQNLLKRVEAKP